MRHLLILPFLLLACEQDYHYIEWEGVDIFYQNPTDSVDVLMVIDNSGSMEPYQTKLGQNFDQFLTYFVEADVNYHIGTVTTDVVADTAGTISKTIITPETPNANEAFSEIVNVGITGSGMEMGLEAAALALSESYLTAINAGFLREEASLSIIFVSDEEDSSPLPVNDYINLFRDVKGQRERDVFNASTLVVTDADTCGPAMDWSTEGSRYIDVAKQTNGVVGNICAESFDSIITELSLNTSRLRDTFHLTSKPDPSSIFLTIDDTEMPCEEGKWSYQLVENEAAAADATEEEKWLPAIVFESDYIPKSNSQIAVRYYNGSGDPSEFCVEE